ncbi:MAG: response regulator [Patescibacteria group bacterium]|nr:response regulator [Patescibacteria group bacterium]MCX7589965.1 response regulator [Patescibacteria group bacterium]MDW8279680.1 response regulator [bacterium]
MQPLVLIVDDDINFREIWKIKLSNSGFNVLTASNGKEALEILKNNKPNIILLDIVMPEMDGIETFLNIKDNPELNSIKVFFITSLDDLNAELANYHKQIAIDLGAAEFLRKATDLNELVDILNKSINF